MRINLMEQNEKTGRLRNVETWTEDGFRAMIEEKVTGALEDMTLWQRMTGNCLITARKIANRINAHFYYIKEK